VHPHDAAAKLDYVSSVRKRARKAALLPSLALLLLGALLLIHGAVVGLRPHDAALWLAVLAVLLLARPFIQRQRHELGLRRGALAPTRLRVISGVAALVAALVAVALGADALVSAVCVSGALVAWFADFPAIAVAALAIGVIGDAALLGGASRAAAELLSGAALVTLGAACWLRERDAR
jgi:hypothetical protein